MTMQATDHPLYGWVPFRFIFENNTPLVQWFYVGDAVFNKPFFDESIATCRSHAYNSSAYKSVSSPESMIEWSHDLEELPLVFIFHISRCGSTLLSQLIGLDQKYPVLSEVPFFDEILRMPYKLSGISHSVREELFKASVKLLGRKRTGKEKLLFIKTDSWHIAFHDIFWKLYPEAAFILLYRSPDEVVASHQKLRGMQAVQGAIEPEVFGFKPEEIKELPLDVYAANVLEKYLLLFEELSALPSVMRLDYKHGAGNMLNEISARLTITWDEDHVLQMNERSRFHSKRPTQSFTQDSKRSDVPGYLNNAMAVYARLDRIKNKELNLFAG